MQDYHNLTKEEKQQLLQENIFDWIKRSREGYYRVMQDDSAPGTFGTRLGGAIGTGLGTTYRYARRGAREGAGFLGQKMIDWGSSLRRRATAPAVVAGMTAAARKRVSNLNV